MHLQGTLAGLLENYFCFWRSAWESSLKLICHLLRGMTFADSASPGGAFLYSLPEDEPRLFLECGFCGLFSPVLVTATG